jgi:DNA helicase HerA-like ATPase
MAISVQASDRVFICGKTGSGKTTLARELTRNLSRLVVLDSKGTLSDWNLADWDRESQQALEQGERVRARVLQPLDLPDQAAIDAFWTDVFRQCFEAGNVTIYVDELFAIVPPGKPAPPIMLACWTRGREFGIGAWASTQRPSWVPLATISESEHDFMFRLTLKQDRQRMSEFMTERVTREIKDPHGFYYMQSSANEPVYISSLDLGGENARSET